MGQLWAFRVSLVRTALVQGTVASSRSVHPSTGVRSQHPTAAVNQIPAILKLLPNLAALKPPETSKIVSELPYLMLTYLLSIHILSLSLSGFVCTTGCSGHHWSFATMQSLHAFSQKINMGQPYIVYIHILGKS